MLLEKIIDEIKRKKELKDLDNEFIKRRINIYLLKNKIYLDEDDVNRRSKKYMGLFKAMRKELRIIYGAFRDVNEKRASKIYEEIFSLVGKFYRLLDLGSGLNPMYYAKLNKEAEYYCCDINNQEIKALNRYFRRNKIIGEAFVFDLVYDDLSLLPKADVIFLFRVLESLEYYERNISKRILENLNSKIIVVSFAKNVLSNRGNIRRKGRIWFRRILKRLNYRYKDYDIGDEIFLVIRK